MMPAHRMRPGFAPTKPMPDPKEHKRLARRWAMGLATSAEIARCRMMDRMTNNKR